MSRYVDVDDLIGLEECIRCAMCVNPAHTSRGCDGGCRYNELMYTEVIKAISQHIDACITDDVESVVHAHWIKSELGTVFCSNCDRTAPSMDDYYGDAIWYYDTPYCPYCGAKMDEVKE